jgi:hypothetical protein
MVKSVSGVDFWWDMFDKPWIESQQQMEGIVRKVEDIDSRRMAGERVTDAW